MCNLAFPVSMLPDTCATPHTTMSELVLQAQTQHCCKAATWSATQSRVGVGNENKADSTFFAQRSRNLLCAKIDAHLRHLTPVTPVKRGASGKQYTHQSRSSLTLTCLLCPASLSSPLLLGLNPSLFCPASARVQSQGLPDYLLLGPCAP